MAHRHAYLLRHCEPENPGNMVYGHLPGYPLSAVGRRQAEELAILLAQKPITHIVASPLLRAQETAQIIAAKFGAAVATDSALREADFSLRIQGVPWRTVLTRRPVYWVHRAYPGLVRGDEKPAIMAARLEQALAAARAQAGDGIALCVSHADPIYALWTRVTGRGTRFYGRNPIAKGSFIQLTYDGDHIVGAEYTAPATVAGLIAASASSLESAGA